MWLLYHKFRSRSTIYVGEIQPSELIAFGDGMNDKEMLELAGYSYAMENAEPALRKVAKYIAPSNNDDGVLQVLDKYLNN